METQTETLNTARALDYASDPHLFNNIGVLDSK
jgi:hypothetical protein